MKKAIWPYRVSIGIERHNESQWAMAEWLNENALLNGNTDRWQSLVVSRTDGVDYYFREESLAVQFALRWV